MNILKPILFILLLLVSFKLMATPAEDLPQEVKVIAKINSFKQGNLTIHQGADSLRQPIRFANPAVEKAVKELTPDEEVILSGKLIYEKQGVADSFQIRTIFIIHEVKAISLKRLGNMDNFVVAERPVTFDLTPKAYAPGSLPASAEVVGSITITASILLLKALTAKNSGPSLNNDLNSGLIFSAGALATGSFIMEQLKSRPKP